MDFANMSYNKAEAIGISGCLILIIIIILALGLIKTKAKAKTPEQSYYFLEAPMVIICDDAPYTKEEVNKSLAYWEDLGYTFFGVIDDFDCSNDAFVYGAITITPALPGFGTERGNGHSMALTELVSDSKSGELSQARIEVLVKAPRVLEHEIGHALGWKHFDINGHIMNHNITDGGWDSFGLEYRPQTYLLKK